MRPLQLPPPHPVAEAFVVPDHGPLSTSSCGSLQRKIQILLAVDWLYDAVPRDFGLKSRNFTVD
jgi:hypothetical protein